MKQIFKPFAALVLALAAAPGAFAQIDPPDFFPSEQGTALDVQLTVPTQPNVCFNWSTAGTLPLGLSLTNVTATASANYQGTPTTPGTYSFEVFAVAVACPGGPTPNPFTANQSYTHVIFPRLEINPGTAPSGLVGSPYAQVFTRVGGLGTGTILFGGGSLPPGLTLTSTVNSATISGTPTTAGTFPFTLVVTDPLSDLNRSLPYTIVITASGAPLTYITPPALPGAQVGAAYNVTLQTTGGVPPVQGAPDQAPALPPGLTLNLATLTISGTPTMPGTYSFPVIARDSQGATTTRTFSITVSPSFRIITTALPSGTVGQPYGAVVQTEGGSPPISFAVTGGALPPGVSLNATTGVLSGIPTSPGRFQFTLIATSGNLVTAPVTFVVSIERPSLDFTPDVLPNGAVGRNYQAQFTATGGTGQYSYSLVQGSVLPAGLALSASGAVTGVPTTEGAFRFVVQLNSGDDSIQKLVRVTIDPPPLTLSPDTLPEGTRGAAYQAAIAAAGGAAPYSFRITAGQLPAGLTFGSNGGISGTPTSLGTFKFTVQATDSRGRTGSKEFEIVVREELRITTESLPGGTQGDAYAAALQAAGGLSPYTFSVTAGALPPGVSLGADGRLTGTPTQAGSFTFTAQVADRSNRTARKQLTILIVAALRLLPESLPGGTVGRAYSAMLSAEGGTPPYTFTLTGGLPPGIAFSAGTISGTPTQAGRFDVTGQVTDSRGRSVNRQYAIVIAPPPPLTISGTPGGGTVGTPYPQVQFTASGGVAPFTFSGSNLPPGLTLSSGGTLTGTPTQAGAFSISVSARDSFGAEGTGRFQVTIVLPPPPAQTLNFSNQNPGANQQSTITLTLGAPYPAMITGFLELTFAPVRGGDDPAIQFSNGSRRINFTIPAGATAAVFTTTPAAVQTGTVAGVITILTTMQSQGSDITPSPRPSSQIRIAAGPPVITRVEVTRTSAGSDLIVYGYSTAREVTQGLLRLTPRSGVTLTQSEFTIPLTAAFTAWYNSSESVQFGSQFRLVIPLTGVNTETVESLTIQLSNSIGSSETVRFGL